MPGPGLLASALGCGVSLRALGHLRRWTGRRRAGAPMPEVDELWPGHPFTGQAPPCVRTERPVGPQPPLPSTVSRATACPPQHPRDRRQWPRFAGEGTEARGGGCRSHVAGGRGAQAAVPRTAGPAGGAADEALSGALTSSPPGTPCCHHPVRLSAAPEATQARRAPALD